MLKPRVLRSSLPTQPRDLGRVALAKQWFPNRKSLCGGIVHHLSHKSRLSFCQNTQSACKCPHVILWPFQHKPIGCEKLYLVYKFTFVHKYYTNDKTSNWRWVWFIISFTVELSANNYHFCQQTKHASYITVQTHDWDAWLNPASIHKTNECTWPESFVRYCADERCFSPQT